MKTIHKIPAVLSLVAVLLAVQSCQKQEAKLVAQQQKDFSNSSLVQVYIATVNAARNYIYVDAVPVTGATLSSGGVFPPGTGAIASNVQPGLRAFLIRDTLPAATQVPLSFGENLQLGRSYTIFAYDTLTSPLQKTVPTLIEVPGDTTARLRFANFVYSPTAIPAVDIFSKKRNAVIFSNVQVSEVTGFIPYASGLTDTFYVRPTGTSTNLQNWKTTTPTGFIDLIGVLTPTQKRSYTLVFRGGYRASATNNSTVRTLSTFANY